VTQANQDPFLLSDEPEDSTRSHRARFFVMGTVVALALGYMIYAAFPGNALYFLTVSEFIAGDEYRDGRQVRVAGQLVPDSFSRQQGTTLSQFRLQDTEASTGYGSGAYLTASYVGVMPDLFFNPHSEIILQGRFGDDGVFQADDILVKCPSKYRSLDEADYMPPELLEDGA
jgi:cytochrome c-type biogenesis protein CcmE